MKRRRSLVSARWDSFSQFVIAKKSACLRGVSAFRKGYVVSTSALSYQHGKLHFTFNEHFYYRAFLVYPVKRSMRDRGRAISLVNKLHVG